MRKIFVLMFVLLLGVALVGCGKKNVEQVKAPSPEAKSPGLRVTENNTLMGWLKRGKVVECKISAPEGEIVIRAKNNNVRVDGIVYAAPNTETEEAESGTTLTVGDTMYLWSGDKGTKMDLKKIREMGEEEVENEQETWEEMVEDWEDAGVNYVCMETTAPDSLFTPPADVSFVDLTGMMEGFNELGNKLEESVESGEPLDMEELEKKMEELQEQFGE